MKRNLVLLGICLLAVSFVGEAFGQKKKPRIGIAGIQIEACSSRIGSRS